MSEDPRIAFFVELKKTSTRKFTWAERVEMVHEHFPSTQKSSKWVSSIDDMDILGDIVRDILRLDQAEPGKSGPRPAPDAKMGVRTLRQITGEDYSILPFAQAFQILARGMSLTTLARKTYMSRSKLHRLLRGVEQPTPMEMKAVAGVFRKHPAYFFEFRAAYIMAILGDKLEAVPEASITLYQKVIQPK